MHDWSWFSVFFVGRLQPKFDGQHATIVEKWHIAYSATNASEVRKRLDTGDLLAVSGEYISSLRGLTNLTGLLT